MPFVERRNGRVIGRFENAQPGYAEEFLSDDHADLQPSADELAEIAAKEAQAAADEESRATAKADNVIQYIVTHTPAECAAYVNANVNNLDDAKAFLGKVAMALSVLARRELR